MLCKEAWCEWGGISGNICVTYMCVLSVSQAMSLCLWITSISFRFANSLGGSWSTTPAHAEHTYVSIRLHEVHDITRGTSGLETKNAIGVTSMFKSIRVSTDWLWYTLGKKYLMEILGLFINDRLKARFPDHWTGLMRCNKSALTESSSDSSSSRGPKKQWPKQSNLLINK